VEGGLNQAPLAPVMLAFRGGEAVADDQAGIGEEGTLVELLGARDQDAANQLGIVDEVRGFRAI
jgi:hypothetical protein